MCETSSLGGVAVPGACEDKIQYVFNGSGCGSSDQKATENPCPQWVGGTLWEKHRHVFSMET